MILNFDAECQRTNQVQEENEVLRQKVCSERCLLLGKYLRFVYVKSGRGRGGLIQYRKALILDESSQKISIGDLRAVTSPGKPEARFMFSVL